MRNAQKLGTVERLFEAFDLVPDPLVENGWKAEEKEAECGVSSEHEQKGNEEHIGENYIRKSDH